jgi:hypothetical protein
MNPVSQGSVWVKSGRADPGRSPAYFRSTSKTES